MARINFGHPKNVEMVDGGDPAQSSRPAIESSVSVLVSVQVECDESEVCASEWTYRVLS